MSGQGIFRVSEHLSIVSASLSDSPNWNLYPPSPLCFFADCAICKDGYAPTLAYTCAKCSSGDGITFAVLTLTVGVLAVVAASFYLVSEPHQTETTLFRRLRYALPVQGLKTVVVAWQILTQVRLQTGLEQGHHPPAVAAAIGSTYIHGVFKYIYAFCRVDNTHPVNVPELYPTQCACELSSPSDVYISSLPCQLCTPYLPFILAVINARTATTYDTLSNIVGLKPFPFLESCICFKRGRAFYHGQPRSTTTNCTFKRMAV